MITLIEKPAMPGTTILVIVLVIALIVALTILQASCKKTPQDSDESQKTNISTTDPDKTQKARKTIRPEGVIAGEHTSWNDPKAPIDITATDILTFDMSMTGGSGDIQGYIDLALCVYDENDKHLLKQAAANAQSFKESGYILSIDVVADRVPEYESGINIILPVDKDFTIRLAETIRQSGVISMNGKVDWTSGIPVDTGEFVLAVKYASGDYLSISVNSYLPDEGIALYRALRPLLINVLMKAEEDYVPLLNLDSGTETPKELVKGIHESQSHMIKTETYNFSLMIDSGRGYLSGNFADAERNYSCHFVEIEDADCERLIHSFVQTRYYYALEKKKDDSNKTDEYPGVVYDETTYSFSASFHGIRKSFLPIRGIGDEANEDLYTVFSELVKKYSE
ncbi:MAG TPA: hypothetical protein GX734_02610 [Clostridiaceae bacterium]|nr:hypothetical protein [Clostridiaceae bacterium]